MDKSSVNARMAEAEARISAQYQLAEVVAGRPASGWKKTFHERMKKVVEQALYEEPFEAVFVSDHPEWKNPHERGTDAWFAWEMVNIHSFQEAFKKWLDEQRADAGPPPLK